jgi:hypothetical protein
MNMFRPLLFCAVLVVFVSLAFFSPETCSTQMIDSIGSEHVRLRLPAERESLGRDLAAEIERCYVYMNRTIGGSLPRKILIFASVDEADSSCNRENAMITLGLNHPAASVDLKRFLLHNAGKEMARLGLLELSGGAQREDTEFLFEGMAEILVREYEHSSRSLDGAWVICKYLDEMKLLGLTTQRSWTKFSAGNRCFRSAAPGITLLMTYREPQGKDVFLKLFETLKKKSLTASLTAAFKAPPAEIESTWLKKVREYQPADEITITADEVPELSQTMLLPGSAKPGSSIEMQFIFRDRNNNLLPEGIFVKDERTGRLLQPRRRKELGYFVLQLPIEADSIPGDYKYQVAAIDESGNLRRWTGSYKVSD